MADLIKVYKKKPSLAIWTLFGIGILFFMYGTLFPIDEPMINTTIFIGEGFFGAGIIVGAILVLRRKKR